MKILQNRMSIIALPVTTISVLVIAVMIIACDKNVNDSAISPADKMGNAAHKHKPVEAASSAQPSVPAPAPLAGNAPIVGDEVTLEVAQQRTPYVLPVPTETITQATLKEAWVSLDSVPAEFRQAYLIYSNGLRVSIGGRPDPIDFDSFKDPSFQAIRINGIPGSGKDPGTAQLEIGGQVAVPGSVSWWINGVWISIYHDNMSMAQLLRVAESMPEPVWK